MYDVMLFQEHLCAGGKVFYRHVMLAAVPRKGELVTINFIQGAQEVAQVEHVIGEEFPRVMLEHTSNPWCSTSDQTIKAMIDDGWKCDTILQPVEKPCSESEPPSCSSDSP